MSAGRAFAALALADFRERVRRRSFLAALAATAVLGLQAIQGRIVVALGEFQGAPGSAWSGSVMTLVATTFLSLIGFYLVKNAVERDRQTGVGQILAATPVSRWIYTLAKATSHWAVLAAMVGVLAIAAAVMQLASGTGLAAGEILAPLVFVALPAMAVIAGVAILFETIPGLRGGFGNIAWFFVWGALFAVSMTATGFDLFGVKRFQREMGAIVKTLDPAWDGDFVITGGGVDAERRFDWPGLAMTGEFLRERAGMLALGIALAAVAALPFDRFDSSRRRLRRHGRHGRRGRPRANRGGDQDAERGTTRENTGAAAGSPSLRPLLGRLPRGARSFGLARLAFAEGWVHVRSNPKWWWAVAAAIMVAGWVVELARAREVVLLAGFLWPALVWSGLGCRERSSGVEPLLASSPRRLGRQLPATWLGGAGVGVVLLGGVALRLAAAGEWRAAFAVLCGCGFVAALALACGILSGGPRLFEGLYVAVWYVGPLNQSAAVDFAGITPQSAQQFVPLILLVLALALVGVAVGVNRRRAGEHGARFA
jgi:hypothetical protein